MGTRADFYIGTGKHAEWLGSVAWDGYEVEECNDVKEPANRVRRAQTADDYRVAVTDFLDSRDDATYPVNGWPWPWDDSNITDYAYSFVNDSVKWWPFYKDEESDCIDSPDDGWPDMSEIKNVSFGKNSGIILITA